MKIFLDAGVDTTLPVLNSCGSGVTACVVDLGLRLMGNTKSSVYDGSWSEYGAIPEPDFNNGSKYGWEEPGKKN